MSTKSNQLSHDILKLEGIRNGKALSNLVMALSSYEKGRSVVELSESPLFHYQYSSISGVLSNLCSTLTLRELQKRFRGICLPYVRDQRNYLRLHSDVTGIEKPHSPTLKDRGYIHCNNTVIRKNKPITIGYPLSCVHLSLDDGWSLPLSMERVGLEQTAGERLINQLERLAEESPFKEAKLIVHCADSAYSHPGFLAPLQSMSRLVNIIRFRHGSKVFSRFVGEYSGKGRPTCYGKKYYLRQQTGQKTYKRKEKEYVLEQVSITELTSEQESFETLTKKGRRLKVDLKRWNDLLRSTKAGHKMSDKPFDLLQVQILDAQTNKPLYRRPMYLGIYGQQKDKVGARQAYEDYRHRYDIEPCFRFEKQKLLLDKFQTPDLKHLDNWFSVVYLAIWMLFAASDEVEYRCRKWEKYLGKPQKKSGRLSLAQTRKGAEALFLTFDPKPFLPKSIKNGKGRKKGTKQGRRKRFGPVKKDRKRAP